MRVFNGVIQNTSDKVRFIVRPGQTIVGQLNKAVGRYFKTTCNCHYLGDGWYLVEQMEVNIKLTELKPQVEDYEQFARW